MRWFIVLLLVALVNVGQSSAKAVDKVEDNPNKGGPETPNNKGNNESDTGKPDGENVNNGKSGNEGKSDNGENNGNKNLGLFENPCAEGPDSQGRMYCLTCKDAPTDEACLQNAKLRRCPSKNHICEKFEHTFGDGTVKIDRGCQTLQSCRWSALKPNDKACNNEMKNGQATKVCRTCMYEQCDAPDFFCSAHTP